MAAIFQDLARMSSKTKTTSAKEDGNPALVPKLRFPEFREAEGWEIGKVDELVDTVTPPKKLPTSHYASKGAFPIIDQSQADICGWTDDHEALIQGDLPFIIFGDHTCILKLIDRPFAQGADGIKILKSRPKVGTPFLYQYLTYRPVVTEEYKRHYSILKEKLVSFPDPKTGEQKKIAECLSSVDELIAAQGRKVDALKAHKKGLMQQLFPREGETQPRLRFPEFKNVGEWEVKRLSGMIDLISGMHLSPGDYSTAGEIPYFTGPSDFTNDLANVTKWTKRTANVSQTDDTLITVKGSGVGEIWYSTLPEVAMGRQLMAVRSKNGSSRFMFQFLLTKRSRFEDLGSGNLIPGLSRPVILDLEACFPKPPEQQRIADCLTSLDDLVAAQTKKLDVLKTHKKGLMQQLFPSPMEVEA